MRSSRLRLAIIFGTSCRVCQQFASSKQRQQVQEEAFGHIKDQLDHYRVETRGVYIQDVVLPSPWKTRRGQPRCRQTWRSRRLAWTSGPMTQMPARRKPGVKRNLSF